MSGEALGAWLGYEAGKQEAEEKARIAAMSPKKRAAFYAEKGANKQLALDTVVTTGLFGLGMAAGASDNPVLRTVGPVAGAVLPAAYVSWRAGWLKSAKKKLPGVRL